MKKIIFNKSLWIIYKKNTHNRENIKIYYASLFIKFFYLVVCGLPYVFLIYFGLRGKVVLSPNLILNVFGSVFITFFFIFYPLLDIYGRLIIIKDGKIIQREKFIFYDEVEISKIKKCYIKYGVNVRERRGAVTLRIEHEDGIMDINAAYYSVKDLKELTELIGFPDVIKK